MGKMEEGELNPEIFITRILTYCQQTLKFRLKNMCIKITVY